MHKPKHTTLVALLAFALALAGLFALPMRLHAAGSVVYVDAGASGAGDGSSWANAYPSLADALTGAASGTEIWVATGTYKPTSGADRTATFQLKDGVAIYGGFAGNETQRDQRDWQTNVTLLSGDLNGDDSGAVSLSNPTRADSSFTPAALLASSAATCVSGQVVSFALDANPLTGAAGAYALGTATTNSSGQATMPAVNTTGWLEGIYTINISFAGTPGCLPSSDSATLTVASPGAAANGGGWYTLSGSGRVNFGFTVRKVDAKCASSCC